LGEGAAVFACAGLASVLGDAAFWGPDFAVAAGVSGSRSRSLSRGTTMPALGSGAASPAARRYCQSMKSSYPPGYIGAWPPPTSMTLPASLSTKYRSCDTKISVP